AVSTKPSRDGGHSAGGLVIGQLNVEVLKSIEQRVKVARRTNTLAHQDYRKCRVLLADGGNRIVVDYFLCPVRPVEIQTRHYRPRSKLRQQCPGAPFRKRVTVQPGKHAYRTHSCSSQGLHEICRPFHLGSMMRHHSPAWMQTLRKAGLCGKTRVSERWCVSGG